VLQQEHQEPTAERAHNRSEKQHRCDLPRGESDPRHPPSFGDSWPQTKVRAARIIAQSMVAALFYDGQIEHPPAVPIDLTSKVHHRVRDDAGMTIDVAFVHRLPLRECVPLSSASDDDISGEAHCCSQGMPS